MGKSRLEAFSDGVLAIIITIMVLELKVPAGDDLTALTPLIPVLLSYVLSFAYVGIYWNNHHHMLQASRRVTGGVLLANLNLLFWLSLLPFATAWIGRNHYARVPGILYGGVLLASALAYWILQQVIILSEGKSSTLARAVGSDWKGKASLMAYTIAIAVTFVSPIAAQIIYAGVALLWLIPDRRIETQLHQNS